MILLIFDHLMHPSPPPPPFFEFLVYLLLVHYLLGNRFYQLSLPSSLDGILNDNMNESDDDDTLAVSSPSLGDMRTQNSNLFDYDDSNAEDPDSLDSSLSSSSHLSNVPRDMDFGFSSDALDAERSRVNPHLSSRNNPLFVTGLNQAAFDALIRFIEMLSMYGTKNDESSQQDREAEVRGVYWIDLVYGGCVLLRFMYSFRLVGISCSLKPAVILFYFRFSNE